MSDGSNVGIAQGIIADVENVINQRLAESYTFTKAAQADAQKAIDALAGIALPAFDTLPTLSAPDLNFEYNIETTAPNARSFGTVTGPSNITAPTAPALVSLTGITIPDFNPSISSLTIPTPPAALDTSGLPTHPVVDLTFVAPAQPGFAMPDLDQLNQIAIPSFIFPTLPTFDATAPEFEGSEVSTVLQWAEPVYMSEVMDDVLAQVRTFFAGGNGIPPAVEAAIFGRAMDREEMLVEQDVKATFDEIETLGYTLPPGIMIARLNERRQKATLAKQGAQRELTIKAADWMIENLKFACTTGIAAENLLSQIFLNQAQRLFDAAKYTIEAQISYYNANVALFNARQNAYSTAATVFKIKVDAELSKLEVYKAEIEGQVAIGQLNQQLVQIYTARIQAVQTAVEIYKAEIAAAQAKVEAGKAVLEGYQIDVSAYAAKVNAEKVVFDAYTAEVNAVAAQAGIIEAQARAFAAVVQGKSAQADIQIKQAELPLEEYKAQIEGYKAALDADRVRMQYQVSAIQEAVAAYTADTQRYVAQVQAQVSVDDLQIKALETADKLGLAYFEAQIKQYEVNMQRVLESAKILVQSLTASGTISSTLAAGAMAALHVGAQLTGQASIGANAQDTTNVSTQTSTADQTSTSTVNETITNINGTA